MRRHEEDANWYRAQIVLITAWAVRARQFRREHQGVEADDLQLEAYERSVEVTLCAMRTRDAIESTVGKELLADAEDGGELDAKMVRRAGRRNRRKRSGFDARRAVELHALLARTFEPGALLLVAANVPGRVTRPPDPPSQGFGQQALADHMDASGERLGALRRAAKDELERVCKALAAAEKRDRRAPDAPADQLDHQLLVNPEPLIRYVARVPHRAPRVVYNLACYYSRQFDGPGAGDEVNDGTEPERKNQLQPAFELLRESISRTPPLERHGLLQYAENDDDLAALLDAYGTEIAALRRLLPVESRLTDNPAR